MPDLQIPENLTAISLETLIDQALVELLDGSLPPRAAAALAQLVNARRRLIETIGLEARVAELERKSVEAENLTNGNGSSAGQVPQENEEFGLGNASADRPMPSGFGERLRPAEERDF